MDENTAWTNFVSTGSVRDYLTYCEVKLGYPQGYYNHNTEAIYENRHGGTDTDRTDNR